MSTFFFFFSSRRRHTRWNCDWSSDVCSSDLSHLPEIRRLVGTEGAYGEQLGLTKDWVVRIVKHVGKYGEVFDRNVGTGSKLGISRGLNRLWTKGGIQYAPPIR